MEITEEEIKLLESDGWEIISTDPIQIVLYAQFCGGEHKLSTIEEVRSVVKDIIKTKEFYNK